MSRFPGTKTSRFAKKSPLAVRAMEDGQNSGGACRLNPRVAMFFPGERVQWAGNAVRVVRSFTQDKERPKEQPQLTGSRPKQERGHTQNLKMTSRTESFIATALGRANEFFDSAHLLFKKALEEAFL